MLSGPFDPKLGSFKHEKSENSVIAYSNRCVHCNAKLQATWSEAK